MKLEAIFRLIIKPAFGGVLKIPVIAIPCIPGNLDSQVLKFIKLPVAFLRNFKTPIGDQFPRCLPHGPVCLLQVHPHLHQRLFLALEFHSEGPHLFLVLLTQLRFLRLKWHVLFAE